MARPLRSASQSRDALACQIRAYGDEVGLALSEDDAAALAGNLLAALDAVAVAAESLEAPFDQGQVYADEE